MEESLYVDSGGAGEGGRIGIWLGKKEQAEINEERRKEENKNQKRKKKEKNQWIGIELKQAAAMYQQ